MSEKDLRDHFKTKAGAADTRVFKHLEFNKFATGEFAEFAAEAGFQGYKLASAPAEGMPDFHDKATQLIAAADVPRDAAVQEAFAIALSWFWHEGFKAGTGYAEKAGKGSEIEGSCEGCKQYLLGRERLPVHAIHAGNDNGMLVAYAIKDAIDAAAYVCEACKLVTLDLRVDRVEDTRQEPTR